ncbi:hypothetical protein ACX1F1_17475 [Yersinia pseudotuberculosis]|uniref:hypothetical protein n=1 Tax=Yersinia pseudotuberculosis TaxID=633 RepID=UPI001A9E58F7|nr:hypothetical protein [Yersinia pseudotuberculosis]MBO1632289.1 hypothetical protein [Yersinia pseudotuberculosis]MBP0069822.1 hypothetical protein [Yersinia pseudotuberculosis]
MPTSYEHQLNTLLERFNFHFTKSQIQQVIDTVSRSKDAFKADVLSVVHGNQDLQDKLDELGLLGLQLDTRQVEVFTISDATVKAALDSLFGTVQPTTEQLILDAFPFPIENKTQLNQLRTGTVYPVKSDTVCIGTDTYNRLIICTVIDKEIEEPALPAHLSQAGQQLLSVNTTFTMKRKVRIQLFHVIYWCAALSKLILSVDRNVMSISVCQDQLFILRQFLMAKGIDSGRATNVFGAIEPLYNAADGYITKLGHVTTDGNPVRIPLKSQQKCLKQDHYHQAGEGGGHVHAKFAVAKKWEFQVAGTSRVVDIEVSLMGQPKMLDTAQPLTDFSVNKSKRLEDFNFAIDKVLSLIPNP